MERCKASTSGGEHFLNELRVLAVDDDINSLKVLELLLVQCGYKVSVAQCAHDALKLLRENRDGYDIVITEVNMQETDGFMLLDIIGIEMNLPVIMLSENCDVKSVMKAIRHGAVDYLAKPVRLEELKVIWKHVVRKFLKVMEEANDPVNKLDHANSTHSFHNSQPNQKCKNHKNVRDYDDDDDNDGNVDDGDDNDCNDTAGSVEETTKKKPRVTWNKMLHSKFIDAVNQLGLDRAVPKKILDIMNTPGLSRENVASHLQKYKRGLKKNIKGLGEHFDPNTITVGQGGRSDFRTTINQFPPISSLKKIDAVGYKCMSEPFTCVPAQQFHATLLPTSCTHPYSQRNDFGQQYPINTQSDQLITRQECTVIPQTSQLLNDNSALMINSLETCAPTETSNNGINDLNYMSFPPRLIIRNSCTPTSQFVLLHSTDSPRSSAHLLKYADGLDDNFLVELNAMLPLKQVQEFTACSGVEEEVEVPINIDLADVHKNTNEVLHQSSLLDSPIFPADVSSSEIVPWNDIEYEENLHALLNQPL